uniref:C2H2-type domain-containing protein n=1 Tax=Steinernema glaseri TaxID=37863 RepID=A0A1I8A4K0_9BILA
MATPSSSPAAIGPSTSEDSAIDSESSVDSGGRFESFLQLETVGISTLCDLSLMKLSSEGEKPISEDSNYVCRLCTRLDSCVVRGAKLLSSRASRVHFVAHVLTYKALLRFESTEVLCPVCGTLVFTAEPGEPLIELELINHIESEHAKVILKELAPATLTPLQCDLLFGVSSEALGANVKLRRKNYAYCLLCHYDVFTRYRVPQAQHYFEWILEDHVTSHLSNVFDVNPDYAYHCSVCKSEPVFNGASCFLQHIFTHHRKKLDLACLNNNTEYLCRAYGNLYIRIFGILAPLAYKVVNGGILNPFDPPKYTRDEEKEDSCAIVKKIPDYRRKKKNKPTVVRIATSYINCERSECGHETVEEDDVALVKHMILHVKHDEHRMKHHKEGTTPVWCCPKADKIFTTGGLLMHFVSAHFYDNDKVDVILFNFLVTRCTDILRTIAKSCFGSRSISPFKVMALLIDLDVNDDTISLWMNKASNLTLNETFVELWANVVSSRNLDAEDADYICFSLPFIQSKGEEDDEILWLDNEGSALQRCEDSDLESVQSEEDTSQKCTVVPMFEIVVSVRRCRYELRGTFPAKKTTLVGTLQRKRRLNPKRMPVPESIVVELREGREIDPFNLNADDSEAVRLSDDSDIEVLPTPNRPTRCGRRPLYDNFCPSDSIRLTTSGQLSCFGIAMGQIASRTVRTKRTNKPHVHRVRTDSNNEKRNAHMKDKEATKKLDSALESFISDAMNSLMPEEMRNSVQCAIHEPSPPKLTLHELLMEQIEMESSTAETIAPTPKRGRPRKIETAG